MRDKPDTLEDARKPGLVPLTAVANVRDCRFISNHWGIFASRDLSAEVTAALQAANTFRWSEDTDIETWAYNYTGVRVNPWRRGMLTN